MEIIMLIIGGYLAYRHNKRLELDSKRLENLVKYYRNKRPPHIGDFVKEQFNEDMIDYSKPLV